MAASMNLRHQLHDAGIAPRHFDHGEQRLPCPDCDRGPKDTALALKVDERGVTWLCHRCGLKGGVTAKTITSYQSSPRAHNSEPERGFTDFAAKIWSQT